MNLNNLIKEWRDSVPAAAKAKADVVYLTEFRKSKKAILMQEAQQKGLKTGQEREAYAYAHAEYRELLDGLRVAVENHEYLRNRMKIAETRISSWQTQERIKSNEVYHGKGA
jgi:hypothetical protein